MTPSNIAKPRRSLLETIEQVSNPSISFTATYLSTNIPHYNSVFYSEAEAALQSSADLSTLESIGVGQQSHVARLSSQITALDLEQRTLQSLKREIYDRYYSSLFSFCVAPKADEAYSLFFNTLSSISQAIEQDLESIKKYKKEIELVANKLNFYYDLFKLLSTEVVDRLILSKEQLSTSIIAARIVSLHTSITVMNQLLQVVNIKQTALETERSNLISCSTVLKVSLDVLYHQDYKQFEKQFKSFLKS